MNIFVCLCVYACMYTQPCIFICMCMCARIDITSIGPMEKFNIGHRRSHYTICLPIFKLSNGDYVTGFLEQLLIAHLLGRHSGRYCWIHSFCLT